MSKFPFIDRTLNNNEKDRKKFIHNNKVSNNSMEKSPNLVFQNQVFPLMNLERQMEIERLPNNVVLEHPCEPIKLTPHTSPNLYPNNILETHRSYPSSPLLGSLKYKNKFDSLKYDNKNKKSCIEEIIQKWSNLVNLIRNMECCNCFVISRNKTNSTYLNSNVNHGHDYINYDLLNNNSKKEFVL